MAMREWRDGKFEQCPDCGAECIQVENGNVGNRLAPAMLYYSWCGCGMRSNWTETYDSPEESARKKWEFLNPGREVHPAFTPLDMIDLEVSEPCES